MRYLPAFALVLAAGLSMPALAQQPTPRPTADMVTIQILETEARNYRATIGQLAVQINELTAERDALKTKCGKACETDPTK